MPDVLVLILCLLSFCAGFLLGGRHPKKEEPPGAEMPERLQKQWANFWAYDGTEVKQEDVEED